MDCDCLTFQKKIRFAGELLFGYVLRYHEKPNLKIMHLCGGRVLRVSWRFRKVTRSAVGGLIYASMKNSALKLRTSWGWPSVACNPERSKGLHVTLRGGKPLCYEKPDTAITRRGDRWSESPGVQRRVVQITRRGLIYSTMKNRTMAGTTGGSAERILIYLIYMNQKRTDYVIFCVFCIV